MSFVSSVFFLFLPAVVLLYRLLPGKIRWVLLLAASLLFYAWHNVWLLGLVITTILVSYLCARVMETAETEKGRRQAVIFCTVVCIGILVVFKYLDFAAGTVVSLCNLLGAELSFSGFSILLPMGISFYVFQTMSYTFDVYRGRVKPEHHLGHYALFVTFFPQLVAGPIERPADLLPQLKSSPTPSREDLLSGLQLLIRGYAKKLLIADYLSIFVDAAYSRSAGADGSALALATVFFAFQIYCDFSGYSDIAQGCARLMGIRLSDNFRTPYAAASIRDFWRRWHISLTSWFTDYLYIPLGGSRKGSWTACRNTVITFLVSGLWHGANWTYVIWGGLHGVYLSAERLLRPKKGFGRLLTFILVCFSWIFFRSESTADAFGVIGRIFSPWQLADFLPGLDMTPVQLMIAALMLLALPTVERLPKLQLQHKCDLPKLYITAIFCLFLILAMTVCRFLVLTQHGQTAFIYFQF